MTVQEYRDYIAAGNPVENGSEPHLFMHQMAQEAIRITMEINNKYHTPEELRELFSKLWDIDVPETFGMFPPFNTDCGKNTHIGERVFINSGCKFQDQGGIFIGNDCLIGHNATLCTINHNPDPEHRGDMTFKPIRIEDKVWIGANVTILQGVTTVFIEKMGRFCSKTTNRKNLKHGNKIRKDMVGRAMARCTKEY